jgi:hypothetical protein
MVRVKRMPEVNSEMFIERQCTVLHGIVTLEDNDALHEMTDQVVHVCRACYSVVALEAVVFPLVWSVQFFNELLRWIVRLVDRVGHIVRDCVREVPPNCAARCPAVDVVDSFVYPFDCREIQWLPLIS